MALASECVPDFRKCSLPGLANEAAIRWISTVPPICGRPGELILPSIVNSLHWLSIELSNSVWSKACQLTICRVIRAGADRVGLSSNRHSPRLHPWRLPAMGGHLSVIWQPWEFVIIGGASRLARFIVANPMSTIKDTGRAMMEAILDRAPTQRHYLDVLESLHIDAGIARKGP